ncbi:MAG: hypothetical protein ACLP50_16915, partial [Solirubrobacteraceae bacterium]
MALRMHASPTSSAEILVVHDEYHERRTFAPGRHWPYSPELIGPRDARAGGAHLAVAQPGLRIAVIVNGPHVVSAGLDGRSRGSMSLRAAAGRRIRDSDVAGMAGFHLLLMGVRPSHDNRPAPAEHPVSAELISWDGETLSRRQVPSGDHVITWSGLDDPQHARGSHVHTAL